MPGHLQSMREGRGQMDSHTDVQQEQEGAVNDEEYEPPRVTQRVLLDINQSTGDLSARRCRVHFGTKTDATAFMRKLQEYLSTVKSTGGFDIEGCGWLGAGVSAASQDVRVGRRPVNVRWHQPPEQSSEDDDVRRLVDILHTMRDPLKGEGASASAPAPLPRDASLGQGTAGMSLLDLHTRAQSARKEERRSATSDAKLRGDAVRLLTRSLFRGGLDGGMEAAMDNLSLEGLCANPDVLWETRKLHTKRVSIGNTPLTDEESSSYGPLPSPASVMQPAAGQQREFDNASIDGVHEDEVSGDDLGMDGDVDGSTAFVNSSASPYRRGGMS